MGRNTKALNGIFAASVSPIQRSPWDRLTSRPGLAGVYLLHLPRQRTSYRMTEALDVGSNDLWLIEGRGRPRPSHRMMDNLDTSTHQIWFSGLILTKHL